MNYYLYDKLLEEHRQEMHSEMARKRLLARSSRRSNLGRRAIGKLGVALVAVGLKLEHFDHSRQPQASMAPAVQR